MSAYFKNIADGITSTIKGMSLTMRHMIDARKRRLPGDIRSDGFFDRKEGMVTIQYPQEVIPIPDHGRYRLHNEMDDCIVCDKCAKVCPVDCIDIEPIKATEEVGRTSDGSPIRLYAAKFDIDMAKCCYCGLCTTVCPTECLTMTKTFDYSELDVMDMIYHYASLSPEKALEKKDLLEQFQKEKEAQKLAGPQNSESNTARPAARPAFKPSQRPLTSAPEEMNEVPQSESVNKRAFRPAMKPKATDETEEKSKSESIPDNSLKRPVFKPVKKGGDATPPTGSAKALGEQPPVAGRVRPVFRPGAPVDKKEFSPQTLPGFRSPLKSEEHVSPVKKNEEPKASGKGVFRPVMKPKTVAPIAGKSEEADATPPAKASFRPTKKSGDVTSEAVPEAKARPVFKPTLKKATAGSPAPEPEISAKSSEIIKRDKFRPFTPEPRDPLSVKKAIESLPSFKLIVVPGEPRLAANREEKGNVQSDADGSKDSLPVTPKEAQSKPKTGFRPTMKPKP